MKLFVIAIAFFIGYLIFLYTFQSGKTIYIVSEGTTSDTLSSSSNIQLSPSMTVTVEIKRGKTFGIFPNVIDFYFPKISNGILYFKKSEVFVEKIHYIVIFLVILLTAIDFILQRKNIYTNSYINLWKKSYF